MDTLSHLSIVINNKRHICINLKLSLCNNIPLMKTSATRISNF